MIRDKQFTVAPIVKSYEKQSDKNFYCVAKASQEQVDYDNEIVSLDPRDGFELLPGCKLLDSHNKSKLPIGLIKKHWIEPPTSTRPRALFVEMMISSTEPKIIQKVQQGVITDISIGFLSDKERSYYREDGVLVRVGCKIFEISVCSVASNVACRILLNDYKKEQTQELKTNLYNMVSGYTPYIQARYLPPKDSKHHDNLKYFHELRLKYLKGENLQPGEQFAVKCMKQTGIFKEEKSMYEFYKWELEDIKRIVRLRAKSLCFGGPPCNLTDKEIRVAESFLNFLENGSSGMGKQIDSYFDYWLMDDDNRRSILKTALHNYVEIWLSRKRGTNKAVSFTASASPCHLTTLISGS